MSSEGLHVPREKLSKKTLTLHNAGEELKQAAMVLEWMRRNDDEANEQLKKYLFTEEDILRVEHEAGHGG